MNGTVHTMPVNDLIDHTVTDDCTCGPTLIPVPRDDGSMGWQAIHHALDGREFTEPDYTGPAMPKEPR